MIGSMPAQSVRNFCDTTCSCAQSDEAKRVMDTIRMKRAKVSFRDGFIVMVVVALKSTLIDSNPSRSGHLISDIFFLRFSRK